MKIAVTIYDGRVSPVYGVAKEVLVLVLEDGREVHRERRALDGPPPIRQVRRLADLGVDTLICGGITTGEIEMLQAAGISVVDQAAGPVDRAIREYLNKRLDSRTLSRADIVNRSGNQTHGSPGSGQS